jgi:putative DNA primase/helicase
MNVVLLKSADIWPDKLPPIGCAAIGVGVGKTEAMIRIIAMYCCGMVSAVVDQRGPSLMFIYAVPTHELAEDIVARLAAVGVTAGVWRGRLADNPLRPGDKMCLKPEAIQKVASIGLSIQQSMCRVKSETGYVTCEHYSFCAYQQQAGELCDKQVVVVPHDSLFYEMPDIGDRNILITDEAFFNAGLRGV